MIHHGGVTYHVTVLSCLRNLQNPILPRVSVLSTLLSFLPMSHGAIVCGGRDQFQSAESRQHNTHKYSDFQINTIFQSEIK